MLPRKAGRVANHRTRFHSACILLLAALGPLAHAGASASPESLTQALVTAALQYHAATSADRAQRLADLVRVAAARYQLLAAVIESDPGAVLRVAVPTSLRASLPSAVQGAVEEEVDLDGVLEVLHEDHKTGSRSLYFLEVSGTRFSLHFAADPPALGSGSRVRVKGVRVGEALALDSGTTSVRTLTAALPNTFAEQRTIVILVNFQDNPIEPFTVSDAWGVAFNTTSNFVLENSYQQTWLSGEVYGWYTIPLDSTVCDQLKLAAYAKSAATAAGVDLSVYARYVYAFPQNACGWWGAATVGGSPSQAWINGRLELAVLGHELGHNLGLEHSHSLVCNGTTIGPDCTTLDYGDGIDIMGWSASAHFNAFQKERLGWLNHGVSPPITTVQTDGTYVVEPYEPGGANPKALKILKSTDPTWGFSDWYYVEFRQAIGFDRTIASSTSSMDSGNILTGVVIHMGSEGNGGNTNALLDMTPETYHLYTRDPALVVGRSFSDPEAGVTITTLWTDGRSAGVSVAFSTPLYLIGSGLNVSVWTDKPSYSRGQTVSLRARVSSGGSLVAKASVTFVITKSNGTVVTHTATTDSSGTATLKLRLKQSDPVGVWGVRAGAAKTPLSGSAATSFTVQ